MHYWATIKNGLQAIKNWRRERPGNEASRLQYGKRREAGLGLGLGPGNEASRLQYGKRREAGLGLGPGNEASKH